MSNKVGQPTKYKTEYCQLLVEHMKQGLSFESFAGLVNVDRDTIYEWVKVHKEFSDAKKQGFEQSRLFWELAAVRGATGQIANFNATMAIFNLKNRFPKEWRDKQEIDHSNTDGSLKTLADFYKDHAEPKP